MLLDQTDSKMYEDASETDKTFEPKDNISRKDKALNQTAESYILT